MISMPDSDDSGAGEKTVLHIAEETDDDLLASTPTTHTTEDLFTIIHRFEYAQTLIQRIFQRKRLAKHVICDKYLI